MPSRYSDKMCFEHWNYLVDMLRADDGIDIRVLAVAHNDTMAHGELHDCHGCMCKDDDGVFRMALHI